MKFKNKLIVFTCKFANWCGALGVDFFFFKITISLIETKKISGRYLYFLSFLFWKIQTNTHSSVHFIQKYFVSFLIIYSLFLFYYFLLSLFLFVRTTRCKETILSSGKIVFNVNLFNVSINLIRVFRYTVKLLQIRRTNTFASDLYCWLSNAKKKLNIKHIHVNIYIAKRGLIHAQTHK